MRRLSEAGRTPAPKERPILFSAPMVRALLDGRKTQTRRVMKWRGSPSIDDACTGWESQLLGSSVVLRSADPLDPDGGHVLSRRRGGCWQKLTQPLRCPYGAAGDLLWVRETFATADPEYHDTREGRDAGRPLGPRGAWAWYAATDPAPDGGWRPSIHMPRWASRLTLEVVACRGQRLHDLTEDDARAEGVERVPQLDGGWWRDYSGRGEHLGTASESFASLWDSLHGPGAWAGNPWVWAVTFRVGP